MRLRRGRGHSRYIRMAARVVLVVLCLLGWTSSQSPNSPEMDMYGMINTLYYRADRDLDGFITEPELNEVYQGFDKNGDKQVTHDEFTSLWTEMVGQSPEMASAYFFLDDINDNGIINNDDVRPTYVRFDLNGDGQVEAQEFNLKWQEIYRESPFAALYLRTDRNSDDDLQPSEYPKLLSTLDSQANGSAREAQFKAEWVKSHFGRDIDAEALFKTVDANQDGVVSVAETGKFLTPHDKSVECRRKELLPSVAYQNA